MSLKIDCEALNLQVRFKTQFVFSLQPTIRQANVTKKKLFLHTTDRVQYVVPDCIPVCGSSVYRNAMHYYAVRLAGRARWLGNYRCFTRLFPFALFLLHPAHWLANRLAVRRNVETFGAREKGILSAHTDAR